MRPEEVYFQIPDEVINELSYGDDSDYYAEAYGDHWSNGYSTLRLAKGQRLNGKLRDDEVQPDPEMEAAFGGEEAMHALEKGKRGTAYCKFCHANGMSWEKTPFGTRLMYTMDSHVPDWMIGKYHICEHMVDNELQESD